jgi:hypothetical protein
MRGSQRSISHGAFTPDLNPFDNDEYLEARELLDRSARLSARLKALCYSQSHSALSLI